MLHQVTRVIINGEETATVLTRQNEVVEGLFSGRQFLQLERAVREERE
jgi:hypothetical protein